MNTLVAAALRVRGAAICSRGATYRILPLLIMLSILAGSCTTVPQQMQIPELPAGYPPPAPAAAADWTGPTASEKPLLSGSQTPFPTVRFMTASDLHYLSPRLHSDGPARTKLQKNNDGKLLTQSKQLMEALVQTATGEQPDFLVITGDLTMNGTRRSHEEVHAALKRIEERGTPVFVLPGNHDLNNPWAASFHGETSEKAASLPTREFSRLYASFGYAEATSRAPSDLSYTAEPLPGLVLLCLDTNMYSQNMEKGYPQSGGAISPDQQRWMKNVLDSAQEEGKRVIVFSHHSMLPHTSGEHGMGGYTVDLWPKYARLLWDRSAQFIFSGHIHAQDITAIRGLKGEWLYDISTGAWSVFPHSYRIISAGPQRPVQLSGSRLRPQQLGTEGEQFLRSSRRRYLQHVLPRFAARITEQTDLSKRRVRKMALYPALLNLAHFAGEEQLEAPQTHAEESLSLWQRYVPQLLEKYHRRMGEDKAPLDNRIKIHPADGHWRSLEAR